MSTRGADLRGDRGVEEAEKEHSSLEKMVGATGGGRQYYSGFLFCLVN